MIHRNVHRNGRVHIYCPPETDSTTISKKVKKVQQSETLDKLRAEAAQRRATKK